MNVVQLAARLVDEGFSSDVYSLVGVYPSYEGLVLEHSNDRWTISHVERGIRRELETFGSEGEACEKMYELLSTHFR